MLFTSLNGVRLPKRLAVQMKQQGMRAGDPDLRIECKACTIYIELKAPTIYKRSEKTGRMVVDKRGGTVSDEQRKIHRQLKAYGRKVYVIDNLIDFKKIVNKYII